MKTKQFFRNMVTRAAMTLLLMLVTTVFAWSNNVNYIDADGSSKSHDANALSGSDTQWTGWYVASGEMEISDRVVVNGEAHLILRDGATLAIPKGISVTENNSLTIYGQTLGTGSLTIASVESGYAGIGGYVINSSTQTVAKTGTITINGGTIDVTGASTAYGGAAIGGVYWGNTGTITINGGMVTATGKQRGAGIGSGSSASAGGTITITGGKVVAKSESASAGIGGSNSAVTPDIYIHGGNVTAESIGNTGAAGIGAGVAKSANIITITGGTVNAIGGVRAAGIGGGTGGNGTLPGNCGTVTITGGTVTAIGGEGGSGIGGGGAFGLGYPGANGGTIIITGGNVTARTTYNASYGGSNGIGHGYAGNSTDITADIRLSWTAASNSITAEGYTGAVTITDGKTMTDGTDAYNGELASDQITAIAGKTLRPCFALADNADNVDVIANNAENTFTFALLGRTLYTDGYWNTLCLPFNIDDFTGTPLDGFTVKELDTETDDSGHKTGFENGTLYLNFRDATSIEAGIPYIVKKTDMRETSATPTYTATNGTAGSMSAQGYDKLINGSTGGYMWRTSISENNPSFCEFQADQLVSVTGYILTTGNQNATGDPTVWTLYGKLKENDAWTVIDSRNATTTPGDALPSGRTTGKSYTVQNPGIYQYFLFEVTKTGGNFMCLSELTLQGTAFDPTNIVNPVFSGVTINADDPTAVTSSDNAVSFIGSYSPVVINGENKTMLYLGSRNTLYYPSAAMSIGSCRAYFQLQNGLTAADPASGINHFVLNFGEETNSIEEISNLKSQISNPIGWFTLDGRKLNNKPATKGIYINNGKKYVIK